MKYTMVFLLATMAVAAQTNDSLKNERFSLHAQLTTINQFKPAFSAPYSGLHSLMPGQDDETSFTSTFYVGARLWKGASLFVNPEVAAGSGLSSALGVASALNGETFRIGSPDPKLYLARLFYRQIFALKTETTYLEKDFNQPAMHEPTHYVGFVVGKIGITDYFDDNAYAHDPREQFMAWSLMANGAWDYPANTRGYTPSVVLLYVTPKHELHYGFSLVPLTANGPTMNWDISKAGAHTLEYTYHYKIKNKAGAVRLLGFYNTTNMGSYTQALALAPVNPVIEDTRQFGRSKTGIAINADQELGKNVGVFFRASWNDGRNETWAFTEIDQCVSAGVSLKGAAWKRANDNVGFAAVAAGISKDHRNYLAAGGKGFMLGDGQLNYAPEYLSELYYSAALLKEHIFLSAAYQLLLNPGYNHDRKGPANVFSLRLHARI